MRQLDINDNDQAIAVVSSLRWEGKIQVGINEGYQIDHLWEMSVPSIPLLEKENSRKPRILPGKKGRGGKMPLGINDDFQIPDTLWERIVRLLPLLPDKKKSGRPRMDDRKAMTAIFYILRTGCQWKALPRSLGAGSTVHDRFQFWCAAGLFTLLWHEGLLEYDFIRGIDWQWQAMDGSHIKAPLGGDATGPSPVDRAKRGTNRHILTDGNGIPLSVVVDKANRNDMKLVQATLASMNIEQPEPTKNNPQHICLDKGYDYKEVENIVAAWGYTAHIRRRGEDECWQEKIPHYRAHRWVVERTHSWLNRFRRMLIRWEKKVENYLGLLHFACAWICFRAAEAF